MKKLIHLEIEGETVTLDELINTNNVDGQVIITADDISRINALAVGESTGLENSHTGSMQVTRVHVEQSPS